jgi:type IV pilus assembly protein PilP
MRKKGINQKNIVLFVVLLIMISAGCKKEEATPMHPQPVQNVKPQTKASLPVQKQQSSAHVTTSASPSIDFSGRKDPFKPYIVEAKPVASRAMNKIPGYGILPMQNYELGQFRVLGIIAGLNHNSALIVDPAGKSYVVKPGMDIGKNGGRIVKISSTTIEVLEKYKNETGRIVKRIVKLTLPKKE